MYFIENHPRILNLHQINVALCSTVLRVLFATHDACNLQRKLLNWLTKNFFVLKRARDKCTEMLQLRETNYFCCKDCDGRTVYLGIVIIFEKFFTRFVTMFDPNLSVIIKIKLDNKLG